MYPNAVNPVALLVQPPVYDFALYDLYLKPLGLLRVGAWLRRGGYEVRLVNALDYADPSSTAVLGAPKRKRDGTGKFHRQAVPTPAGLQDAERGYARYGIVAEELSRRIATVRPDIVLVGSGMTYWYPGVAEAVRTSRAVHPRVPVVVGGVYATLLPAHCRRVCEPDEVAVGGAAEALAPILAGLGLPVPPGRPDERLLLDSAGFAEAGAVQLNTGCPFSCDYCAAPRLCPAFTAGRWERVLAVVEGAYRRFGTTTFAFYDDALLARARENLIPFLEAVIQRRLPVSFALPNAVHLRWIDGPLARLMHRAGVREVRLGYESDAAEFHERHDRKLEPRMLDDAVEALLGAGYAPAEIRVYVLAGLPGQRAAEVEHTVGTVSRLGIRVSPAEYSPVPGSALWDKSVKASRYPIAEEPLLHNNSFFALEWEAFTRRDMKRIKELARSRFLETLRA